MVRSVFNELKIVPIPLFLDHHKFFNSQKLFEIVSSNGDFLKKLFMIRPSSFAVVSESNSMVSCKKFSGDLDNIESGNFTITVGTASQTPPFNLSNATEKLVHLQGCENDVRIPCENHSTFTQLLWFLIEWLFKTGLESKITKHVVR